MSQGFVNHNERPPLCIIPTKQLSQMICVDPIEVDKQDMIDVSAELINGKCLEVRGPFLHVGKVILRYDRGSIGVALCDSLCIVGIELPFIIIDGNRYVLVAKAG